MKNSPADFFVSNNNIANYCTTNNIIYKKLANGSTLAAISRGIKDSVITSINYNFKSGSYFDPDKRQGLHHLTEHLINKPLHEIADNNDVSINAATSALELKEMSWGPTNPQVTEYGLWQLTPLIINRLTNPLNGFADPQQIIETEKHIVRAEIKEKEADYRWQVIDKLYNILYTPDNPLTAKTAGTQESLEKITVKDITDLIANVFIPGNLLVSIIADSDHKSLKEVVSGVENVLTHFPGKEKKANTFTWSTLDRLNKNIIPGKTLTAKLAHKNGLVSIIFCYIIEAPLMSPRLMSFERLVTVISQRIFTRSREKGWGYTAGAGMISHGENKHVMVVRVDTRKEDRKSITAKAREIKSHLQEILFFTDEKIKEMLAIEKSRQRALPVEATNRLSWMITGLTRYGKVIDADKIKQGFAKLNYTDLKIWVDHLSSTQPFTAVIGDI